MADDDLVLLDQWCAGDKGAGNALFKRHFAAVYRFFEFKTERDIDDLVQETFMACVHSRDKFRRQSSFKTYLFAIARHTLAGYWRRRMGDRATPLDFDEISVESLSTSVGTRLAQRQDLGLLLAALRALPLDQQTLLEMYYWEELDREQLAEVFEVASATIGSRLYRARQALHEGLSAVGYQQPSNGDELDAWARSLAPAGVRPGGGGDPTP